MPWLEVMLAGLPAALHAVILLGRLHPDEVYQSLEIALNRTWGFGVVPWEWLSPPNVDPSKPWGIRNWSVPLLFSTLLRLGDAIGIKTVMGRRVLLELPQFALHVAMLGAVWRLAWRRVGASGARWCLWLVALYGPLVWFGGRTMSESFSTAFLVWGLERLDARDVKPGWWALGGALLGFAQVTRYGSAAAIVPAMAWLLFERRWKTFALATTGGIVVALMLGALDYFTWGEWFHSLIHYFRFNVSSGAAAAQFGAAPWWLYLPRLLIAPFALVGLAVSIRGGRTRWPAVGVLLVAIVLVVVVATQPPTPFLTAVSPWVGVLLGLTVAWLILRREEQRPSIFLASALGYLAILAWTAHKEDRFVYPAIVMLTVAAAPLFIAWLRAQTEPTIEGLGWVAIAAGIAFYLAPSPLDVQRKEQFQFVARNAESTTGLVVMNDGLWGSPGFFYVGKNIPWCPCDFPHDGCFQMAARDARFNRAVYWSNGKGSETRDAQTKAAFEAAGFHVAAVDGFATWFAR